MIQDPEEKDLFTKLYPLYIDKMFSIANNILKNHHDSEDAVHDAFLAIIPLIGKLPSDPKHPRTKALITTVIESKAIDIYRKRQRSKIILWDDLIDEASFNPYYDPFNDDSPEISCISKLSPSDQRLLILRHHVGLSAKEIAKAFGKKEDTVAHALTKAKQRLKALLEKEGAF